MNEEQTGSSENTCLYNFVINTVHMVWNNSLVRFHVKNDRSLLATQRYDRKLNLTVVPVYSQEMALTRAQEHCLQAMSSAFRQPQLPNTLKLTLSLLLKVYEYVSRCEFLTTSTSSSNTARRKFIQTSALTSDYRSPSKVRLLSESSSLNKHQTEHSSALLSSCFDVGY
jgi:hypothetical protein